MTNKGARNALTRLMRTTAVWGGITAGMIMLFGATADASTTYPTTTGTHTVRVVSTPEPTKAMHAAVRRCAPAPKDVRQACHSLYLRPQTGEWPAGRKIVAECFGQADVEARAYPGPRTWAKYLRGCILGNIRTP